MYELYIVNYSTESGVNRGTIVMCVNINSWHFYYTSLKIVKISKVIKIRYVFFSCYIPPPPFFFTVNDETKIFGFNLELKDNCRETTEGCGSVAETHPAWQSPCSLLTGGRPKLWCKYSEVWRLPLSTETLGGRIKPQPSSPASSQPCRWKAPGFRLTNCTVTNSKVELGVHWNVMRGYSLLQILCVQVTLENKKLADTVLGLYMHFLSSCMTFSLVMSLFWTTNYGSPTPVTVKPGIWKNIFRMCFLLCWGPLDSSVPARCIQLAQRPT